MNRATIAALVVAAALLGGCAATGESAPSSHGQFVTTSPEVTRYLAADAATQLASIYPPAKTQLTFQIPTTDAFGVALVPMLREKGFAVAEHSPQSEAAPAPEAGEIGLRYVVDAIDANLYRVVLFTGERALSRAYATQEGVLFPAGYWLKME